MPKERAEEFDWENKVGVWRFSLRPNNLHLAMGAGYIVSQLLCVGNIAVVSVLYAVLDFNFMQRHHISGSAVQSWLLSQCFFIPFNMGVVASYFWINATDDAIATYQLTEADTSNIPRHTWRDATENCAQSDISHVQSKASTTRKNWGRLSLYNSLIPFVLPTLTAPIFLLMFPFFWFFMWLGLKAGGYFWSRTPF